MWGHRHVGGLEVKALEPRGRASVFRSPPGLGCPRLCCFWPRPYGLTFCLAAAEGLTPLCTESSRPCGYSARSVCAFSPPRKLPTGKAGSRHPPPGKRPVRLSKSRLRTMVPEPAPSAAAWLPRTPAPPEWAFRPPARLVRCWPPGPLLSLDTALRLPALGKLREASDWVWRWTSFSLPTLPPSGRN